ncbi:hypothetical protein V1264_017542 [Littorina saxatilis]|uniref:Ig-like domain-containing protein n=2 Tax=Littorina saxatilis TaxID=31220 RepID=A0AAN9BIV1_9CAEN
MLNGTNMTMTVNGDDQATLYLVCGVYGRPVFTTVTIATGNTTFAPSDIQYQTTGKWYFEAQITLSEVQCHDMGTYICTTDNGFDEPDSKSILLNVRCPPRAISQIHQHKTEGRLDFTMEAYPAPDTFFFIHFGNQTNTNVSSDMFAPRCEQDQVTEYKVNCHVGLRHVPSGLYGMYVDNSLGSANFTFFVDKNQGDELSQQSDAVWPATGGGVALLFVVIVVVVVVILWKQRTSTATNPEYDRTSHFYEDIDNNPLSALQPVMRDPAHDKPLYENARVLLPHKKGTVIYQNARVVVPPQKDSVIYQNAS